MLMEGVVGVSGMVLILVMLLLLDIHGAARHFCSRARRCSLFDNVNQVSNL